jgi:hypothetical protein
LPVHVGDDGCGFARGDRLPQGRGGDLGCHGRQAALEQVRPDHRIGGHAFLGPRAARHGGGDQPARAALVGERVEEGIARCVGDLAAATPHARDRGDQHESIQGLPVEQGVQVDSAGHLGSDHLSELGCVHVGQWSEPAADPRGVHDRGQAVLGGKRAEQLRHALLVSHVARGDGDLRTEHGQFVAQFDRSRGFQPAAADQNQVFGAVAGQPPGCMRAYCTGTAGDQDAATGAPLPRRRLDVVAADDAAKENTAVSHGQLVLTG